MNRATFQADQSGCHVEELGWHDLTPAERVAFKLPDVMPIPGLMTGNEDIECQPWTGAPNRELPPSLVYPSPLQASVLAVLS